MFKSGPDDEVNTLVTSGVNLAALAYDSFVIVKNINEMVFYKVLKNEESGLMEL